jgi:hypothetical protein
MKSGIYSLVDPNIVSLNAYPGTFTMETTDTAPLARVAAELAHVFTIPPAVAGDATTGLSGPTWPTSPEYPGQNVYAATYMAFCCIDPPIALAALDEVIPAAPFPGRAWASAVALSLGERTRLKGLLPLMMDPERGGMLLQGFLYQALINARFSEQDISLLGQLLWSKQHVMRAGAYQALARMASPASVPALEAVIDSSDQDIDRKAVSLICFEINQCGSAIQREYYSRPENHPKLKGLIRKWEKSRLR